MESVKEQNVKKEHFGRQNQDWPGRGNTSFDWVVITNLIEEVISKQGFMVGEENSFMSSKGTCPTCSRNTKKVSVDRVMEGIAEDWFREVMENKVLDDFVRHCKLKDLHLD